MGSISCAVFIARQGIWCRLLPGKPGYRCPGNNVRFKYVKLTMFKVLTYSFSSGKLQSNPTPTVRSERLPLFMSLPLQCVYTNTLSRATVETILSQSDDAPLRNPSIILIHLIVQQANLATGLVCRLLSNHTYGGGSCQLYTRAQQPKWPSIQKTTATMTN